MSEAQTHKILITGATGFIGLNLIEKLSGNKNCLVGLSRHSSQDYPQVPHYTFNVNDDLQNLLAEVKPSIIIHAAALNPSVAVKHKAEAYFQTNYSGTKQLFNAFTKHIEQCNSNPEISHQFINLSTYEIFGSKSEADMQRLELSPYSESKYKAYQWLEQQRQKSPARIVNMICSNNFGPHQGGDKLIPNLINCMLKNQAIDVYGDGSSRRNWVFVEDTVDAINSVIIKGGRDEYLIGSDDHYTVLEIVNKIYVLLKDYFKLKHISKPKINWRASPVNPMYSANYDALKEELGWAPKFTLETGLIRTIEKLI